MSLLYNCSQIPSCFSVSPTTVSVTFLTQVSPVTQYFCISSNGVHPDLEVALLTLEPARPEFDAQYKLVYKNKGTTTQSGSVDLTFNDAVLDLVVANPTATSTDETPTDNTFAFNQPVVNSFDPNDKTCLEGSTISPSLIGQYVHYMIRFENNGTANAQNIVVKDMIDLSKFDISTLVPTSASHSFVTKISAGNKVEFIFDNINLPFDDANNDGYIAFKIKTLSTLVVGNTFTNDASIYFDYNFPIVTNKATSTFKTLGTQDFEFSN